MVGLPHGEKKVDRQGSIVGDLGSGISAGVGRLAPLRDPGRICNTPLPVDHQLVPLLSATSSEFLRSSAPFNLVPKAFL
jgi:hypothetical protein